MILPQYKYGPYGQPWRNANARVSILPMERADALFESNIPGLELLARGDPAAAVASLQRALAGASDSAADDPAAAAFAVWQERIGRLLGLEKLKWNSVLPEYDPFKYQSFAVNAGDQAYRLTGEIASRLGALAAQGGLEEFPPVLAFQSAVDATVSATAVVDVLMAQLPARGHELVLFDLNRARGTSLVLVTHDEELARRAGRVIRLRSGEVVADESA